jgi:hypothetical protein
MIVRKRESIPFTAIRLSSVSFSTQNSPRITDIRDRHIIRSDQRNDSGGTTRVLDIEGLSFLLLAQFHSRMILQVVVCFQTRFDQNLLQQLRMNLVQVIFINSSRQQMRLQCLLIFSDDLVDCLREIDRQIFSGESPSMSIENGKIMPRNGRERGGDGNPVFPSRSIGAQTSTGS